VNGVAPAPGAVVPAPGTELPRPKDLPPAEKKVNAPATIVVTVPAEARVTVDGYVTKSTSATRTFVSPALEVGVNYSYTLQAEIVREGRTVVETQRINVRAGETTRVPFTFSSEAVASR
jgi:uncharacterized protein (TIGR03000 family)